VKYFDMQEKNYGSKKASSNSVPSTSKNGVKAAKTSKKKIPPYKAFILDKPLGGKWNRLKKMDSDEKEVSYLEKKKLVYSSGESDTEFEIRYSDLTNKT
jgi:hypothetical protein